MKVMQFSNTLSLRFCFFWLSQIQLFYSIYAPPGSAVHDMEEKSPDIYQGLKRSDIKRCQFILETVTKKETIDMKLDG